MQLRSGKYALALLALMSLIAAALGDPRPIRAYNGRVERDHAAQELWRIRSVCVAAIEYAQEHGGDLPAADNGEQTRRPYLHQWN